MLSFYGKSGLFIQFFSQYHGKGCYKWCAPSGRELVIASDGVLEINPELWGLLITVRFG